MSLNFKNSDFEIKKVGKKGIFEGYASVFGVMDRGSDVVERGAFKKSLSVRKGNIAMLWQHDPGEPIGSYSEIFEDKKGLFVKGELDLSLETGRKANSMMANYGGLSIGYRTIKAKSVEDAQGIFQHRLLKELDIWEVSVVTFPMNEDARFTSVKTSRQDSNFETELALLNLSLCL